MSTAGFDEIDFSDETQAKSVGSAGVDTESTVTTAVAVEKRGGEEEACVCQLQRLHFL